MHRIPPSVRLRQTIADVLTNGLDEEEDLLSTLARLAMERLLQEVLEQEVTDYLGREHYQRRAPDAPHRGYRNGYEPSTLRTAEGEVSVQAPQVREAPETYRSRLLEHLEGRSEVLERLAVAMYARGLSTRDVEEAFGEATGERLLSRTAVSELTDSLWEEYEAFISRDLSSFPVEYLFLDAVYESLRQQGGGKEGVLCAWAVCRDGRKVMVHLALGNKESYANWLEFLRDMDRRGLRVPVLVVTDGAPGLVRAVEEMYADSLRQRCLVHKVRNVTDKVPDRVRDEVKAAVQAAYYAPNGEVAAELRDRAVERYGREYPSAMRAFQEDWEACVAYLRCPAIHHKRIRTTNLLERSFLEERRRTKVIPRFFTEKSCLKLVFATLWRASLRWRGVRMTEVEQQQLAQLRHELGIAEGPAAAEVTAAQKAA